VATVVGSRISVNLESSGDAFYQPVIDGVPGTRFKATSGTAVVTIGDGLSAGAHSVELYRESESMMGSSRFLGFTEGTVTGAPPYQGRLLEIVGDSISCGYGNLGNDVHPPWTGGCTFSIDTQSAYQAYSAQLARLLGAEASIVCRSGWGLYRGLDSSTASVLPAIFERAVSESDAAVWGFARQPDAVLVNLGTNDAGAGGGSDPGAAFETAGVAFIGTLRTRYPQARIFLTIGTMTSEPLLAAMQGHLDAIVSTVGDPKVTALRLTPQNAATTGCDYHPNVAEDTRIATSLAANMRAALDW
jgi:lysophospholipase L1-like esterase